MSSNPGKVYGPLVIGSLFASFLSGLTTLQAFLYFRLSSRDPTFLQTIVFAVWMLDLIHTALIWEGMWFYVVKNFGDESKTNVINYCIPLAGIATATVTLITHCFYIRRIFILSHRKFWIAGIILIVAISRMCSALIGGTIMLRITTFQTLLLHFSWVVNTSLGLSCVADILITLSMFALLRLGRDNSLTLNHLIDRLVLYTCEMGTLTGFAAVVAMLCWVILPNKLAFLGFYFSVGKFFANSLLGSLNARYHLRNLKKPGLNLPSASSMNFEIGSNDRNDNGRQHSQVICNVQPLEVSVQREIHDDSQASKNSSAKSEV